MRRNTDQAPLALAELARACREQGNVFASLMNAARVASLGQMSRSLYEVGGQYRRNM